MINEIKKIIEKEIMNNSTDKCFIGDSNKLFTIQRFLGEFR